MLEDWQPLIYEWDNYFLRDDRPIREGLEVFAGREEACSLFRKEPFKRIGVYCGSIGWMIGKAKEDIRRDMEHDEPTPERAG